MIRDYKDSFLHATSNNCCVDSVLSVKCYATLFALSTVRSLELSCVVLEGDSLEVINLLTNPDEIALWSINSFIYDCLLLSSSCIRFTVSHVKHCTNFVTDMLAKHEAMSPSREA